MDNRIAAGDWASVRSCCIVAEVEKVASRNVAAVLALGRVNEREMREAASEGDAVCSVKLGHLPLVCGLHVGISGLEPRARAVVKPDLHFDERVVA